MLVKVPQKPGDAIREASVSAVLWAAEAPPHLAGPMRLVKEAFVAPDGAPATFLQVEGGKEQVVLLFSILA